MNMYLLAHTCHPFCVAVSMIIPEISSLYDNEKLVSSFFLLQIPPWGTCADFWRILFRRQSCFENGFIAKGVYREAP